jgi:hypothetical protein
MLYVVRTFRTLVGRFLESIWLIGFEGSSCDCPLVQAASLFGGLSFDGFPTFEMAGPLPE